MKEIFQIGFVASVGLFVLASADDDLFHEKLAAVHSALSADIADIKGNIYMNILPEIERLKNAKCECPTLINIAKKKPETKTESYNVKDIEQRITAVVKAFMNEKTERKSVSNAVLELKMTLEAKLRELSMIVSNHENTITTNKIILSSQNKEITDTKEETSNIMDKTDILSEKLHNVSNQMETMCPRLRTGLKQPSFVSDWFVMKSQNESLCERIIEHKLGRYPAKVDVQIKPLSDTDNEWIFTGDSVLQSDDDTKGEYGGVVYFYNQTHVVLKTPKINNNNALGILMTTGGLENRFENTNGDQYRFSEALVRVKIWCMDDFPEATFTTDWMQLDVTDESKSLKELSHGLSDYPAFVSVQIRASNGMISEGMAAVMTSPRTWSNVGGVIYAFDDKSIRIWSPYLSDKTRSIQGNSYGKLLGTVDGWGITSIPADFKGLVKVTAWSANSFKRNKEMYQYSGNLDDGIIARSNHVSVDINNDLVTLFVQALDGINRGFLFKGFGASQSQKNPYGGAVYAYNKDGQVKVWRPKSGNDGYLVHINQPYGNGKFNQASNGAAYIVTLLKSAA